MVYVSHVLGSSSLMLQQLYTRFSRTAVLIAGCCRAFAETLFWPVAHEDARLHVRHVFYSFFSSGVDRGLVPFGFCVIMTALTYALVFVHQHIADILIRSPA